MIMLGAGVGGTIGGYLGSLMDHGNFFGVWGILLSTIGGVAGIWAGYKMSSD